MAASLCVRVHVRALFLCSDLSSKLMNLDWLRVSNFLLRCFLRACILLKYIRRRSCCTFM